MSIFIFCMSISNKELQYMYFYGLNQLGICVSVREDTLASLALALFQKGIALQAACFTQSIVINTNFKESESV